MTIAEKFETYVRDVRAAGKLGELQSTVRARTDCCNYTLTTWRNSVMLP
jgi:hypothetical protein